MRDAITLDMSTPSVQCLCKKDKRLAKLVFMVGPITYIPHSEDTYSFLVHEIIEQMLSVKAGQKIYDRLEHLCDGELTPDKINALSIEELQGIGTSSAKAEYIIGLTEAILSEKLVFEKVYSLAQRVEESA